eukprot:c20444_g1_i2 orf=110-379(-)
MVLVPVKIHIQNNHESCPAGNRNCPSESCLRGTCGEINETNPAKPQGAIETQVVCSQKARKQHIEQDLVLMRGRKQQQTWQHPNSESLR